MRTTILLTMLTLGFSVALWAASPEAASDSQFLSLNFTSMAIAKGKLQDRANRTLEIYLPASYALAKDRRFPVVYTFHGFGDRTAELISAIAPLLTKHPESPEFIIVGIDGSNRRGGSFYVNSSTTGNFEDMVVEEVVPLIDAQFRTIPSARGRLLAGFSMGGFAAWNLALAHADLFAGAWACCPGAFDANGLKDAMPLWNYGFKAAYGAAFGPDLPSPAKGPTFDGSAKDQEAIRLWEAGFGNVTGKLANYQKRGAKLTEVRFDYGTNDAYDWIPRGTMATSQAFGAAGIKTSAAGHPAGHQIVASMVEEGFLPLVHRLFKGN